MVLGEVIPFLTAFGLGSIVTAFIQSWLKRKEHLEDRNFEERKKAYVGLLEAYHKAAVEPSDSNAKNFAYWQMRCELVAPQEVRDAIKQIIDTNDNPEARYKAHNHMKNTLRRDLAITKK